MQSQILRHPYVKLALFLFVAVLFASTTPRPAGVPNTLSGGSQGGGGLRWNLNGVAPAAPTTTPTWSPSVSPADAFAALQARTDVPLLVNWDAQAGIPRWLAANGTYGRLPYTPSAAEHGNPLAIARGFLDENRALFRLRSATNELIFLRNEVDAQRNFAHVRMSQTYHGLPVFGKQLVVHIDPNERIVAVSGQFAPDLALATEATIPQQQAEDLAVNNLRHQLEPDDAARVQPNVLKQRTQLMVYVDQKGKATLTWRVKVMTWSPLGEWQFFVNARRPTVVHASDSLNEGLRRQTFTADNTTAIPGDLVIDEGERSSRDPIAQAAHDGAGKVYQYYFDTFQRDAYDNQGSPMISTVHFGSDPKDQENAAWVGEYAQMIYGDGGRIFKPLPYALDVVGHEFTHGVIDSTAQLIYEAESGALNESYADIFGVLISGSDWEVGRDVVKSPPYPLPYLRSLKDPNADGSYDPNNPLQGVGQPATTDEYANLPVSRRYDNGGVHINSGIPNHAAYLVSQAIGNDKLQQIYYRTMTQYLSPQSDFLDAGNATARAASDLYGQAEADAIRVAFGQVGINIGGGDNTPTPPPEPGSQQPQGPTQPVPAPDIPAGCKELLVSGDFESSNGWREVTAKGGTSIIDTEYPRTGQRSAWLGGTDEEAFQYIYQDVSIPANATQVELNYYRLIHPESDGLLGAFASEAKFSIVLANTQGDTVATLEEIGSSQGDDQWRQKTFDLSRLAGKTVRLVFAVETQPLNLSSMFVDDASLVGCTSGAAPNTPPPNAPAPSNQDQNQVYIQGTISDASTGRGVSGAQIFILKPGVSASNAAADDNLTTDEVLTVGTTDGNGVYESEQPIPRNQTYSAIVIARGYRPIIADGEVVIPADAEDPFPVDATLRRSR